MRSLSFVQKKELFLFNYSLFYALWSSCCRLQVVLQFLFCFWQILVCKFSLMKNFVWIVNLIRFFLLLFSHFFSLDDLSGFFLKGFSRLALDLNKIERATLSYCGGLWCFIVDSNSLFGSQSSCLRMWRFEIEFLIFQNSVIEKTT